MSCIDGQEHDYEFIGFLVVADKLEKPQKITSSAQWAGTGNPWYIFPIPKHFTAKIEVHQCKLCGNVKLSPAVFSRILEGDKEDE